VFVLTICATHGNQMCGRSFLGSAPCRDCSLRQGTGGKRRCQRPLVAAPFDISLRGTLTAVVFRGGLGRCARRGASPFWPIWPPDVSEMLTRPACAPRQPGDGGVGSHLPRSRARVGAGAVTFCR